MIRVLVDDNAAFRFGLGTLLGALPELTVVAEAATGDEAVVRALRERPDVVLMDLDMATADDGIAATERLTQSAPVAASGLVLGPGMAWRLGVLVQPTRRQLTRSPR